LQREARTGNTRDKTRFVPPCLQVAQFKRLLELFDEDIIEVGTCPPEEEQADNQHQRHDGRTRQISVFYGVCIILHINSSKISTILRAEGGAVKLPVDVVCVPCSISPQIEGVARQELE